MCGCGDNFRPITGRHGRLEEEGSSNVINRAYCTLCLPVLCRGIGAGKTKANAMFGKEGGYGRVDKLCPVVGLHSNYGTRKLSASVGDEVDKVVGGVRFALQRKSPHVMGKIVNNNEVILQTRVAKNRRCPEFTMYQLKWCNTYCSRPSEGQAHMFAKLTCVAYMSGCFITWDQRLLGEVRHSIMTRMT